MGRVIRGALALFGMVIFAFALLVSALLHIAYWYMFIA